MALWHNRLFTIQRRVEADRIIKQNDVLVLQILFDLVVSLAIWSVLALSELNI